ncbi:MAG: CapA family protein [Myxococcota bacterium]
MRSLLSVATLGFVLSACSPGRFELELRVVGEGRSPVAGAEIEADGQVVVTDASGEATLRRLDHPVLAVVRAPGFLPEPVPLGRMDAGGVTEVRVLEAEGRTVLHHTGDVMLGRRYVAPTEGEPLIERGDGGLSAMALVSDVGPALALADLVSVNLESVVGDLPDEAAYPGKRWLLQSPPEGLAAFGPLGVGVAGLANNHQRDWLDEGVASTLDALDARGVPFVGAGMDEEEAAAPLIVDVGGLRVGVLAFTSVDGDYVNDQYPTDDETPPDPVPEDEAFAWEARVWGEPALGIPVAARRIGSAWAAVRDAEDVLGEAERATLWASAAEVYPELQDWVARRGHGGGRLWTEASAEDVADLREEVDLLVVQLHMGYQFAAVPGATVIDAARASVDAGADLVVAHHPHVLQGLEWYRGRLVAYSLGNFLFDQDFLSTFPGAFLRTVWEGTTLVEARIVPVFLDRYRPVPVADHLARNVGRALWESSLLPAEAERGADLGVRSVLGEARAAPGFRREHSTFVLDPAPPASTTLRVAVPAGGIARVEADGLVRRRLVDAPPADLLVGRARAGLGSFEDEDGDESDEDVAGWTWSSEWVTPERRRPLAGLASLSLERRLAHEERVSARMIARVTLPRHAIWADADGETPMDGEPRWSIRLLARQEGCDARAAVRLALYHFDDLDPTEEPESVLLREVELAFDPAEGGGEVLLDLPDQAAEPVGGLEPNAGLLYVSLSPPSCGRSVLTVDDVEVIEWRSAAGEPDGWSAVDWVRSTGDAHELEVGVLPF